MSAPAKRPEWVFQPLVGVGPLRFGMSRDETEAAVGSDAQEWNGAVHFDSVMVTTYFTSGERLAGVQVAWWSGLPWTGQAPQVTLEGVRLCGGVPSAMTRWLAGYVESKGYGPISWGPFGSPANETLGLILLPDRVHDVLVTLPVMVGSEWARRMRDPDAGDLPRHIWAPQWAP
ncbi:hypothetical protein [Actinoplanes sp. HUAS TT8]|uniref:hypothetical protein n=1 Tax=Actinoplanes sp. HUAS TT8 TaxID=3447453 RepID=UPI003F527D32